MVRVQPENRGAALTALRWTFASRRAWVVANGLVVAYAVIYLVVARALIVDPAGGFGRGVRLPTLVLAPDLSPRYLLSWFDPVFVLYATDAVVLAPSAPAMLTAMVLGALVGVNGAVAIETLVRRPPACEGTGAWWAAASLPSFLASFSCCAPTVLVLLGAGAAGAVVSVIPYVVPTATILLLASLIWSLRRLERTTALDRGTSPAAPAF